MAQSLKRASIGLQEAAQSVYLAPLSAVRHPLAAFERKGAIDGEAAAERLGLSKGQFAETIGLAPETLRRSARMTAAKTQTRMAEMLEIIARIKDWAGGEKQALAWYRAQPIPAFGDRTAESLVKEGKAAAVRDYLDHVALGGYA